MYWMSEFILNTFTVGRFAPHPSPFSKLTFNFQFCFRPLRLPRTSVTRLFCVYLLCTMREPLMVMITETINEMKKQQQQQQNFTWYFVLLRGFTVFVLFDHLRNWQAGRRRMCNAYMLLCAHLNSCGQLKTELQFWADKRIRFYFRINW